MPSSLVHVPGQGLVLAARSNPAAVSPAQRAKARLTMTPDFKFYMSLFWRRLPYVLVFLAIG